MIPDFEVKALPAVPDVVTCVESVYALTVEANARAVPTVKIARRFPTLAALNVEADAETAPEPLATVPVNACPSPFAPNHSGLSPSAFSL